MLGKLLHSYKSIRRGSVVSKIIALSPNILLSLTLFLGEPSWNILPLLAIIMATLIFDLKYKSIAVMLTSLTPIVVILLGYSLNVIHCLLVASSIILLLLEERLEASIREKAFASRLLVDLSIYVLILGATSFLISYALLSVAGSIRVNLPYPYSYIAEALTYTKLGIIMIAIALVLLSAKILNSILDLAIFYFGLKRLRALLLEFEKRKIVAEFEELYRRAGIAIRVMISFLCTLIAHSLFTGVLSIASMIFKGYQEIFIVSSTILDFATSIFVWKISEKVLNAHCWAPIRTREVLKSGLFILVGYMVFMLLLGVNPLALISSIISGSDYCDPLTFICYEVDYSVVVFDESIKAVEDILRKIIKALWG